jgi:tetratricopeptide (TPR) repeat protein
LRRLDLAELDVERQNIFRAVQFGLAFPETWLETAGLILQSWIFIERRGYWRDWIPFISEAIAQCGDKEQTLKGRLLNRLGHSQRLDRQLKAAIASHLEAKIIAQALGDELLLARANHFLTTVYAHQKDFAEAERHGLEALATLARVAPGSEYMATTLNELGRIARWQGDFALAQARYGQAIDCWRELDNRSDLATTMLNLAETLQAVDRFEEALALYDEVIPMFSHAGSELRKILAQTNLGALYYRKGDYALAEASYRRADLAYLRRVGNLHFQAIVANGLGNVLLKQGRLEAADSYLRQGLSLWRQLDDEINRANTMGTLAETLVAKGEMAEARSLYAQACELLSANPDHVWARKLLGEFQEARKGLNGNRAGAG